MRKASILRYCAIAVSSAFVVPAIVAQNSIRLFGPRASFRDRYRDRIAGGRFQQCHAESDLRRLSHHCDTHFIHGRHWECSCRQQCSSQRDIGNRRQRSGKRLPWWDGGQRSVAELLHVGLPRAG
jgi:hypothetical protein